MPHSFYDDIPGFREAEAHECAVRERSMLGMGYRIGGFPLRLMTLRDRGILLDSDNLFLLQRMPTPETVEVADLQQIYWLLGPYYCVRPEMGPAISWRWRRFLFHRAVRRIPLKFGPQVELVAGYVRDMMQDQPAGVSGERCEIGGLVGYVDILRRKRRYTKEEVLSMPLPELFQYLRMMRLETQPGHCFLNPSDRIAGDWMRKKNEEARAAQAGRN